MLKDIVSWICNAVWAIQYGLESNGLLEPWAKMATDRRARCPTKHQSIVTRVKPAGRDSDVDQYLCAYSPRHFDTSISLTELPKAMLGSQGRQVSETKWNQLIINCDTMAKLTYSRYVDNPKLQNSNFKPNRSITWPRVVYSRPRSHSQL